MLLFFNKNFFTKEFFKMANELNKVEGFNPLDYARQITDASGNTSLYLDVQYRKMWFRLANPNGKIVKKICNFDGNLAARKISSATLLHRDLLIHQTWTTAADTLKVRKPQQSAELWLMQDTVCSFVQNPICCLPIHHRRFRKCRHRQR